VAPGFIDIHTHVFAGGNPGFANGSSSISPDTVALRSGVTTVVDAGTSGWQNFPTFKAQVIDRSTTRVLAFLNIFPTGFGSGSAIAPPLEDLDPKKTAEAVTQYRDFIVGTRIGHYSGSDWTVFDRVAEAARLSNTLLLVECHLRNFSLQDQFDRMRPGDISTHAFEQVSERMPVVDEQGTVRPFVLAAQQRGILFDVGHGGAGFWFSQAIPCVEAGARAHVLRHRSSPQQSRRRHEGHDECHVEVLEHGDEPRGRHPPRQLERRVLNQAGRSGTSQSGRRGGYRRLQGRAGTTRIRRFGQVPAGR
jgi:dihydroorotase